MFLSQLGPDQRDSAISQLATENFDIVVIGGELLVLVPPLMQHLED